MKISKRTISILKNFSTIGDSIVIYPGNRIQTMRGSDIVAWSDVEEEFPCKIAIMNLSNLIAVIDKFKDPEVTFKERQLIVNNSNKSQVRYEYADARILEPKGRKIIDVELEDSAAKLVGKISSGDLIDIKKMASALNLEVLELACRSNKVYFKASKLKEPNGNKYEVGINKNFESEDFTYGIEISRLIVAADDYDIYFIPGKIIGFKGVDLKVSYTIGFNSNLRKNKSSPKKVEDELDEI